MGELLALIAIGLFMWLFNVLLPGWLQRRQRAAARGSGPPEPPVLPRARVLLPPRVVASRETPLPTVRPFVATRQRAPVRPVTRQDVRRGVILMTILGPCRALTSPEAPRF